MQVLTIRPKGRGTRSTGSIRDLLDERSHCRGQLMDIVRHRFEYDFCEVKLIAVKNRKVVVFSPKSFDANIDGGALDADETEKNDIWWFDTTGLKRF
jgi:hypothetical protein